MSTEHPIDISDDFEQGSIHGPASSHEAQRHSTPNLLTSGNPMPPATRRAVAIDNVHGGCIPPAGGQMDSIRHYSDPTYSRAIEAKAKALARKLFPGRMANVPRSTQWILLAAGSAVLASALQRIGFPAAFFIGPMIAAMVIGVYGGTIRLPRIANIASQALMGCLIARAITPQIAASVFHAWPLFFGTVLAVLLASTMLGWLMAFWRVLPGTTSVWGTWPGAAPAMIVMAEAYGADAQLVAFMQSLRVACVALSASFVTSCWFGTTGTAPHEIVWFPPVHGEAFGDTLTIAGAGVLIGRYTRLPSGALLIPLTAGAILQATGNLNIELPPWLLVGTYTLLGCGIGLGFTRKTLRHARRAFPKILASILLLMTFCACLAYALTQTLGIDPLTAYLATSPGSMDSIAIIASAGNADLSFVMALQIVRFSIVVFAGPPLARLVARTCR